MKEKIEHLLHNAVDYTDAEFRKAVAEILALFHEHATGEEIAPATVAATPVAEAPAATPEALTSEAEKPAETGHEDGTA